MKRLIIASLILLAILTSCSSPESDGEKQAQEECELWDNYVQNTITAYTNFVKEFGSKNYQTRKEAREELNNRINEVESHLDSKLDELNAKYNALSKNMVKTVTKQRPCPGHTTESSARMQWIRQDSPD